jgi:glycosyltransferase involved in cell wall biosynthesis
MTGVEAGRRRLPAGGSMNSEEDNPLVSIVVPARNEEVSLPACLESLVSQRGVSYEIIVVDDASTDRTGERARSFPSAQVIETGALPNGWTGKNHAMAAGAKMAKGKWLLFTDADTVHKPGSLARAIAEAEQHGAALLSYSPEQEVHGFWERAVMPVIFAELAATYRPSDVSNPASSVAAANGQYILISREAYDAVGGHRAVAADLLEDVGLARRVKASGRNIRFRHAGDAVRTRMYRSFAQMREGWTKNLALLFPSAFRLALLRILEFLLIFCAAAVAMIAALEGKGPGAVASAMVAIAMSALFFKRISKAHFSGSANLHALLGLPIFSYLLLRSRLSYKQGTVSWKGRSYGKRDPGEPNPRFCSQDCPASTPKVEGFGR